MGFAISAALALAATTLGVFDVNDRNWRVEGDGGFLSFARLAPLVFGLGLLLWRSPLAELRSRWFALLALCCPLLLPASDPGSSLAAPSS